MEIAIQGKLEQSGAQIDGTQAQQPCGCQEKETAKAKKLSLTQVEFLVQSCRVFGVRPEHVTPLWVALLL